MPLQTQDQTSKSHRSAMSRRNVILVALAVGLLVPLFWALRPSPVQVDIARISRGSMRVTVDEEGKTRVKQVYVISAPISGKLRRSLLDPGDIVTKNDTVVAVIEPTVPAFLDSRSRQEAEAQVLAARAAMSLAEAEVRQSETELIWAQSEMQRSQSLSQTNVVSARTLERARLEHDKQIAAVARAKANLAVRTAELATASAHLIGPATAVQQAAPTKECCVEVRSPQSGSILKELQESERVVAAGTPLFEIGDPTDIDMVVELLSTDAVKINAGALAAIEGAGLTERLSARVRRVEPAGFTKVSALGIEEQRVKTFLDFEQPADARSRLGHDYRIFARITVWSADEAIKVPLSALFRQGERWAVYKLANGRAALTSVEIGHRNNEHAEVVQGLVAGDQVVLHPSDRVAAGTRIAVRTNGTVQ